MKEGKELYKKAELTVKTPIEPCPVCGADAQDFYRGRIAEAVKFWNEYAKALNAQRRERNWKRAQVLREARHRPLC